MFHIKNEDETVSWKDQDLHVSFYDKLKLVLNIRPNIKIKRLIDKGSEKLNTYFDLMFLMKTTHHNAQTIRQTFKESY